MILDLLSLLCTFENSTKCSKISFDPDSFHNSYEVHFMSGKEKPRITVVAEVSLFIV